MNIDYNQKNKDLFITINPKELLKLKKTSKTFWDNCLSQPIGKEKGRVFLAHSTGPLSKLINRNRGGLMDIIYPEDDIRESFFINLTDKGYRHLRLKEDLEIDYKNNSKLKIIVEDGD